jgi:hypothetical protein
LPFQKQTLLAVLLCLLLAAIGVAANTQTSSQSSFGSDEQPLVVLEKTTHPLAFESNAIGRVEGSRPLQHMLLVLSISDSKEAALRQLLDDQQNPNSPNYHRWLTAKEFASRFGPTDADLQSMLSWLQEQGFTIDHLAASKRWIEVSGTSSQVENAFHTVMNEYRVNGKTYIANSSDLSLPAVIARITRGPVSLNNFGRTAPTHEFRGFVSRDSDSASTTGYLSPRDFAVVYNTNGLLKSGLDGSGVSIAVIGQSQINLADVQAFRKIFGLKPNDPNFLLIEPDPGVNNRGDSEEALLDVEWAGAVAPGATINLVVSESTSTTSGVDLAAAYAIDNRISPIVTDTYEACEEALGSAGNAFYRALWQQAAAEGITVLVSVGDSGAAGCDSANSPFPATNGLAVNGIASTPYNVAVGATRFSDAIQNSADPSATGYLPETAWNESCDPAQAPSTANCALAHGKFSLLASAGGASSINPKPDWQSGPGVPADNARDVPDIALATGLNETVFCTSLGGTLCQADVSQYATGLTLVAGTSASTPAMAGILALIEQKLGAFQGQVNNRLYKLAQSSRNTCASSEQTVPATSNSCVFYDITSGNNKVPCLGGSPDCSSASNNANGFTIGQIAGPGYDLVTGLGSVNATNLASAWKDASPMQTPSASFSVSVSPNPLAFAANTAGSGTVTVTPGGGFTGTVTLACASGGTFLPAGYSCSFGQTNVTVNNAIATTTLSLAPSSSSSSSLSIRKSAAVFPWSSTRQHPGSSASPLASLWTAAFAAALLLLVLAGYGPATKIHRNFSLASGLILTGAIVVSGCGSGGGGGPYATTTTIVSNASNVSFGTPVTFTVTVKPSGSATPTGAIQLYDNGQVYGSPVKVSAGIATFLATTLPVGVHNLTATYEGDAHTMASTSASISQIITGQVPLQISGTNNGVTETFNFTVVVI